jgi:hypothetical protein
MTGLLILSLGIAACQNVSTDKITVGDLARVIPEFASVPASTQLGYAPTPGACRIFTAGDIQRMAARYNVATDFKDTVCFEWSLRQLDTVELTEALQRSGNKGEIVEHSMFPVPAGEIVFPPQTAGRPPQGPMLWRGYIRYAGDRRIYIWAKVKMDSAPVDVLPGDRVEVLVTSGSAQLKIQGRAESAGSKGGTVSVRNPVSGKIFTAQVIGKGSVAVTGE